MKINVKRVMLLTLIVTFISSMSVGCSKKNAVSNPSGEKLPTATITTEPNTLPIVKEPITLTMWATLGKSAVGIKSFDEMLAYQELQKRTGIKLKFIHPTVGAEKEQFNLLIASNSLPDLIEYSWSAVPGGPAGFIKDKQIIPLNDNVNKYAPNLQKVLNKYPAIKKDFELDDGTYYMFPCIYGDPELQHNSGPILRGDWLDKLGMQAPTTIDEWHTLLTAVKKTDLNGNGKNDEIPFTIAGKASFDTSSMFIGAWGITTGFYQNKGKIEFGPNTTQYKEFLQTMSDWYKEGLIDPEFIATDGKSMDAKVTADKGFSFVGAMGNEFTRYTSIMRKKDEKFILQATLNPVLKKGDQPIVGNRTNQVTGSGTVITTACKNVKEAVKLLDYNFSDEGQLLGNFGVAGVTYNMVNGVPTYTDLILKNPDGLDITSAISKYTFHSGNSALVKPNYVTNQRDSLPEQISGRKLWMQTKNEILLPGLAPTQAESKEFATSMNEINSYVNEMFANFIMGKKPLSDYPTYLSTLKGMGIDKATAIMQAQMDRYGKRP